VTAKGQTRPLVREGAPQKQNKQFLTQTLEKEAISDQTSTKWARRQDMLTDCQQRVTLNLATGAWTTMRHPARNNFPYIVYCILASCYIPLTLNICSFVRQCNTFTSYILLRHVSA
jgi:hypothetical protein